MSIPFSAARGNCRFLQQGVELLGRLSRETYATPGRPGRAPVAGHFRCVIAYYRLFLQGTLAGRVNYDAGLHLPVIETDPAESASAAKTIMASLARIPVDGGNRQIMVVMDAGVDDGVPDWQPSTVGRELQFLASHTRHHYAHIRALLEDAGVAIDPEFGTTQCSGGESQPGRTGLVVAT